MKIITLPITLLLCFSFKTNAGGIENGLLPIDMLFSSVPKLLRLEAIATKQNSSGDYSAAVGGGKTGTGPEDMIVPTIAYKQEIDESWTTMLSVHKSLGSEVSYVSPGIYQGLDADWTSYMFSLMAKYRISDSISLFGGPMLVSSKWEGELPSLLVYEIPGLQNYEINSSRDSSVGWTLGVSYKIPQYGFLTRVSYESAVKQEFNSTEMLVVPETNEAFKDSTQTNVTIPEALTFHLESGVSINTLAYFNLRWVNWTSFEVSPANITRISGEPLLSYDKDSISYELGIGHRLDEQWAIGTIIAYERALGGVSSPFAPADGYKALIIGGSYSISDVTTTLGLAYSLSDTDTTDATGTNYTNMSGMSLKLSADYEL